MLSVSTRSFDALNVSIDCTQFIPMGTDLFGQFSEFSVLDINDVNTAALCSLLLYGSSQSNLVTNRVILDSTISYTKTTQRFQ